MSRRGFIFFPIYCHFKHVSVSVYVIHLTEMFVYRVKVVIQENKPIVHAKTCEGFGDSLST